MRRWFFFVVLLAVSLRLLLFLGLKPWDEVQEREIVFRDGKGDPIYYHLLAGMVLHHGVFGYPELNRSLQTGWINAFGVARALEPDALRTPGYPLLVTAVYFVFGSHPWLVLLLQLLLDSFSVVLLFLFCSKFLDPSAAIVAMLWYAIDPVLILHSVSFMSETLFVFFLLLCIVCLPLGRGTSSLGKLPFGKYFLSGSILGLATLTKPLGTYILFIALSWIIVRFRDVPRERVYRPIVFLLGFCTIVLPWIVRNSITFETPRLSVAAEYNLMILHAGPVLMYQKGISEWEASAELSYQAEARMQEDGLLPSRISQFQKAPYWRLTALQYLSKNPALYAFLSLKGMANTLFGLGSSELATMMGWKNTRIDVRRFNNPIVLLKAYVKDKSSAEILFAFLHLSFLALTYTAIVLGIKTSIRGEFRHVTILLLLLLSFFLIAAGPSGYFRFKVPMIPLYLPFVGFAFDSWRRRKGIVHVNSRVD